LKRHFSAPITKDPYKEQKALCYQQLTLLSDMLIKKKPFVILDDRSVFGELVYSKYRNYKPDYFDDFISKLKALNVIVVIFILYANSDTYKKFNIKSKDEKHSYESSKNSMDISIDFINKIHKLNLVKSNIRPIVINSNNYDTLEERNDVIIAYMKNIIGAEKLPYKDYYGLQLTPFNNDNMLLGTKIWLKYKRCEDFFICNLGKQQQTSKFGKANKIQTNSCGSTSEVKYIFVGEAPGRQECGTFGIPFYGDRSGMLFQKMLFYLNIPLFNCFITNVIKCCPEKNKLGDFYDTNKRNNLLCVLDLQYKLVDVLEHNNLNDIYCIGQTAYDSLKSIKSLSKFNLILTKHPAYFLYKHIEKEYVKYMSCVLNTSHIMEVK